MVRSRLSPFLNEIVLGCVLVGVVEWLADVCGSLAQVNQGLGRDLQVRQACKNICRCMKNT